MSAEEPSRDLPQADPHPAPAALLDDEEGMPPAPAPTKEASFEGDAAKVDEAAAAAADATAAAAAAADAPAAPAPVAEDDDEDADVMAGMLAAADDAADTDATAAAAVAAEPVETRVDKVKAPADVTLAELFGDYRPHEQTEQHDPSEYDVLAVCQAVFGDHVSEDEIWDALHTGITDAHRRALDEYDELEHIQPCIDAFGEHAVEFLSAELAKGAKFGRTAIVNCKHVPNPLEEKIAGRPVWFVDMPRVQPNRQTLHFDSAPYDPHGNPVPRNSDRAFYTPHNTMHWAKSAKTGNTLSNARMVWWSDGSTTLHVGSDVYELRDNNERALCVVASKTDMDNGTGFASRAWVETLMPTRHVSLRAAMNMPNSVNDALAAEKVRRNTADPAARLGMVTDAVPVIKTQKERNQAKAAKKPLTNEERFLEMERKARERNSAGLSLRGIIESELDTLQVIVEANRNHSMEQLLKNRMDEEEALVKQRAERRATHVTARNRLDHAGEAYSDNERDDGVDEGDDDETGGFHLRAMGEREPSVGSKRDRSDDDELDDLRRDIEARHAENRPREAAAAA